MSESFHTDPTIASPNSLQSIFAKSSGVRGQREGTMAVLSAGSCDFLRIAEEPPVSRSQTESEKSAARQAYERWNIVRDFLISQGDRVVHFSGEATEMINSLPVKRFVVVTENGLYRVAQSTIETGIFFDCRTNLDHLAQMIAFDASKEESHGFGGAEVQVYLKNKKAAGSVDLAYSLNFGKESARRKSFLLSVCVVRPTLPILQKRRLPQDTASEQGHSKSPADKRSTPRYMKATSASAKRGAPPVTSPQPQDPNAASRELHYSPPTFRSKSGQGLNSTSGVPGHSTARSNRTLHDENEHATPPPEPNEDEFKLAQLQLREQLCASEAGHTGGYNAEAVARRPPEEDLSRTMERENVKAMLISREAKIVQNIEFKLKYPQKVPTRVTPGVEYDKAHEERRVPPDDFNDEELLGPSLYPLWIQWKSTGGLLGFEGMPSSDWTMYDTNDLIDSLRAREDVLYGIVGKRSMRRLIQMRELVEREKQMFLNKQNMILGSHSAAKDDEPEEEDEYAFNSPSANGSQQRRSRQANSNQRNRNCTKVKPFHLSQSPASGRKLRIIDSAELLSEMKQNFEKHLKTLHQLRKDQLEREVTRAEEA